MAYCTSQQVTELVDAADVMKRVSEQDLGAYITQAENTVNGTLRAIGQVVPYASGSVPEFVQTLTATRAAYLLARRHNTAGQFDSLVKDLGSDYDGMIGDLRGGHVTLDDPSVDDTEEQVRYGQMNPHGSPQYRYGADRQRVRT